MGNNTARWWELTDKIDLLLHAAVRTEGNMRHMWMKKVKALQSERDKLNLYQ